MKTIKFLFFSLMCLMAVNLNAQSYVDLGLPSGTLWKSENETNPLDDHGFYTFDEAVRKFGGRLPTKAQLRELATNCTLTWTGSGYRITGSNGNSIFLPAAGVRDCDGIVYYVGSYGSCWSSTPADAEYAWNLFFSSDKRTLDNALRCVGMSVRLVTSKN